MEISTLVIALASIIGVFTGAAIGWLSSWWIQQREHKFREEEWLKNIHLKDVEKLLDGLARQYASMATNLDVYYKEVEEVRKVFPIYLYSLEVGPVLSGDEAKNIHNQTTVGNVQKVFVRKLKEDFPSIDSQFDHRDEILNWFTYGTFWIPSKYEKSWKAPLDEFTGQFVTILRRQRELIEECKTYMGNVDPRRVKSLEELKNIESKILNVEGEYCELLGEKETIGEKIKSFREKIYNELNYQDL